MTSAGEPIPSRGGLLPTTPPADAVLPARNPAAPAPGETIRSHYTKCYACGTDHPGGLRLELVAGEGLTVHGVLNVTDQHQGAPGLAHGGLLTTAFDEALGALNWLLAAPSVTGRLEVDFRRPVPVGSQMHIDAAVVGVKGRKIFSRAVGRLGSPDGPVALTAASLFIQVPLEHFVSNGRPEDVQAAREERLVRGNLQELEVNP